MSETITQLSVYVVNAGSALDAVILPGSAVVGRPSGGGITIDDEGNAHGAANLSLWEERVRSAAGRAFERYPTAARMWLPNASAHLSAVGTIDRDYVLVISDAAAVEGCQQRYEARQTGAVR